MKTISMMIVEDDAMVLEVNRQFIESMDAFEIIATAKTGAEAKQLIVSRRPQLVLLDFYLPDMNGLEVIQDVRKNELNTDFILVTAARDVETIQQVFRYGAIDYIIKPFRFDRLKVALERYQQMIFRITVNEELEQKDVDRWAMAFGTNKEEKELPKGLNEVTLKQIMQYMMKRKEPLSAEEVAKGTGLARVTVRRYLEYMEKTNRLKLDIQYGSVGRPVNRYSIK